MQTCRMVSGAYLTLQHVHTTLMVPTNSLGASMPVLTMLPMKLAVMPMAMIMATVCISRTSKKSLLMGMAP